MDFELSDDQIALQEAMRAFCESRCGSEALHELADAGGPTHQLWQELAEMGVFGLCVPEEQGGAGLGWVEAMVVFEELGRSLVPGPLVATFLAAQNLPEAVSGDAIVTMLDSAARPVMLEHPDFANHLAVTDGEAVLSIGMDWSATDNDEATSLDPLTPVIRIEEEHFSSMLEASSVLDTDAYLWQLRGAALLAAQQLGIAAGATASAVAYAQERKQFDKPIGQFQAVKHLCSDMLTSVEVARAAVYFAGAILDDPSFGDEQRAVSTARLMASKAANLCGRNCVQIHGGMGYTWEMDAHLYLKRAWVLDMTLTPPEQHAEVVAQLLS